MLPRNKHIFALVKQYGGIEFLSPLKDYKGAEENSFSIIVESSKSAKLGNRTKSSITLTCPNRNSIKFDRRIQNADDWVSSVNVIPLSQTFPSIPCTSQARP